MFMWRRYFRSKPILSMKKDRQEMNQLKKIYKKIISAMNVEGLEIPVAGIKFYKKDETIPSEVINYMPENVSFTSCQANKQASLGDAVLLTRKNIGCIAAAITFGLVDANEDKPLEGSRVYTDIMKEQAGSSNNFFPPTPNDFTTGLVYACKFSGHPEFALFGKDDSGRFSTTEIARKAIEDMLAIQPAEMKGVFFFSPEFNDIDITPDVVTMSIRPVELTRLIQAYQFNTGKRVTASMGSVRAVNSDLIVRPYLTQDINISPYCVGARLIAQYEQDRMGIGMPFSIFQQIASGMEASQTGYPFQLYPGAKAN